MLNLMNKRFLTEAATLCLLAGALIVRGADSPATSAPAEASTNSLGPRIQFAETSYDFGRVTSGTQVKHEFVFTNIGDATLEITGVAPGCGCTTVGEWTRKVEPGKTGVIPLNFNSTGYSGGVIKTPHATSNDKTHPDTMFQLHGTVYRPVDIKPPFVQMLITPDGDENATAVAHIDSNEEQPITLSSIVSSLRSFTAVLNTNGPAKNFELLIKTVPPLEIGNNQAVINIQTSSTNAPLLTLIAMANVQQLMSLTPTQINLPPGPLPNKLTATVTLVNQSTNAVKLSAPVVNVPGLDAKLDVVQPGHSFTVTLTVPEGFQAPPNEPVNITLKTDHKRFPQITIPISQPTPPPAPAMQSNNIPVRVKQ